MTPNEILEASCAAFGVKTCYMLEGGRTKNYTDARAVAAYLMRHLCGLTYRATGKAINRPMDTATAAVRRAEKWVKDEQIHPYAHNVIKAITKLNSQQL